MKISIQKMFLLILPILLIGCEDSYLNGIQQRVVSQVKDMIDSGRIMSEYVQLYEIAINDSNQIYRIAETYSPIGEAPLELPSKIIKYKGKYLCFIELDEPEMSKEKLQSITQYSGNPMEGNEEYKWFLGLSRFTQRQTLVDFDWNKGSYFDYNELWQYFSGYVSGYPLQMGVSSHDAMVSLYPPFNIDSLKDQLLKPYHIKNLYGEMYLKNNTDSIIYLSSDSEVHYAVINNHDTLYLSLLDSLPLNLKPNESKKMKYKSISNNIFFKKLPSENAWAYLYNLFCNSTYSVLKINKKTVPIRVMYLDCAYGFDIFDESGEKLFYVFNPGIFDKEYRTQKNIKEWKGNM